MFPRPAYYHPMAASTSYMVRQPSRDRVGQEPGALQQPVVGNQLATAWAIASTVAVPLAAYHGYRRNDSLGWAIGWGLLGGLFPLITIPVAIAQGFGERR